MAILDLSLKLQQLIKSFRFEWQRKQLIDFVIEVTESAKGLHESALRLSNNVADSVKRMREELDHIADETEDQRMKVKLKQHVSALGVMEGQMRTINAASLQHAAAVKQLKEQHGQQESKAR